jgi:hypothetical protein
MKADHRRLLGHWLSFAQTAKCLKPNHLISRSAFFKFGNTLITAGEGILWCLALFCHTIIASYYCAMQRENSREDPGRPTLRTSYPARLSSVSPSRRSSMRVEPLHELTPEQFTTGTSPYHTCSLGFGHRYVSSVRMTICTFGRGCDS